MVENIGTLVALYKTLIEGIRSIKLRTKSKQKNRIHRKIITIQIILENIIDTAEQILSIINIHIEGDSKLDKNTKNKLKNLTSLQRNNLVELLVTLRDDTSEYIFKLFAPQLRRNIIQYIHIKGGRIEKLIWNLDQFESRNLKKLYNVEHYKEGIELLSQLKNCSKDLSNFIKSHINLEEAILMK